MKYDLFGLNILNREISPGLFDFDVPCRTSPICCSRGTPGGWIKIYFLQNL